MYRERDIDIDICIERERDPTPRNHIFINLIDFTGSDYLYSFIRPV